MATYRVKGTSDYTHCMRCGRTELAKTIILDVLDDDGTPEETVHYGTGCAVTVTGRTAVALTRAARAADQERALQVDWANAVLDAYGPAEGNNLKTETLFFRRNPRSSLNGMQAREWVAETLTKARAALAEV